jgi:hypothetical protein
MQPVEGAEAQTVLDAVAAGEAIPAGYAFDGVTVYATDAEDEERIEAGGPVEEPVDPSVLNPGTVPEEAPPPPPPSGTKATSS